MQYYTERHGMRTQISKTYQITPERYELLLKCCEKYYNNIAWKYPEQCPDGYGCCGLDYSLFDSDLRFEIPSLYRNDYGVVTAPRTRRNLFQGEDELDNYNQFTLLDYIEFFANNCKDVSILDYHKFFQHHHMTCKSTSFIFNQFQNEINDIFRKTGLLYRLEDNKRVERIVENTPLTPEIENSIEKIKEEGTRDLLKEAIALYKQPYPEAMRDAVEKIWDALERLKTYYTEMDKKDSASKIVNDISGTSTDFKDLINNEFKALTTIGNQYRIRHHETNKIEIQDPRHYDYFFNRCLSLIALAIQYLE